eukprot:1156636-Pelagomonas_calceolata.AAC.3
MVALRCTMAHEQQAGCYTMALIIPTRRSNLEYPRATCEVSNRFRRAKNNSTNKGNLSWTIHFSVVLLNSWQPEEG